jgi:hypothetical protein
MGDAPHWKLTYVENKEGESKYEKGTELGVAFDNWEKWIEHDKLVVSQRIILKEEIGKGDVLFLEPMTKYIPKVARYSEKAWDFYWRMKNSKDYYAHAFLNKGKNGPYFKIYVEEDLLPGEIFQNPRKGAEDMIEQGGGV